MVRVMGSVCLLVRLALADELWAGFLSAAQLGSGNFAQPLSFPIPSV